VLAEQKANGATKKLTAFQMADKSAPPRPHYPIWSTGPDAAKIGEVVSGTRSPSLGVGIGLGYVPAKYAKPQTPLEIEIRGKRAGAVVVPKPFYRRLLRNSKSLCRIFRVFCIRKTEEKTDPSPRPSPFGRGEGESSTVPSRGDVHGQRFSPSGLALGIWKFSGA